MSVLFGTVPFRVGTAPLFPVVRPPVFVQPDLDKVQGAGCFLPRCQVKLSVPSVPPEVGFWEARTSVRKCTWTASVQTNRLCSIVAGSALSLVSSFQTVDCAHLSTDVDGWIRSSPFVNVRNSRHDRFSTQLQVSVMELLGRPLRGSHGPLHRLS